jgi:hypothetical protein
MASMLIWQTPLTDNARVSAIARNVVGPVECLRRADGRGTIILCEQGRAPEGVLETSVTPVISSGNTTLDAGRWLFYVIIAAPREWRDELCDWYRTEHGPILLECPQWRGFTLCESAAGDECRLHVLHRLADRNALDSEERKRSRATPWFERLARNAWFDGPFERILAERIQLIEHATQ